MKQIQTKCQISTNKDFSKKNALKTIGLFAFSASIFFLPNHSFANGKRAEIVVDANTGNVLHEENATEIRHPASITKVMTLYMLFEAMENGKVSLDDQITFSRNATRQSPTKLGVPTGGSISVETAILALIIQSANDTAVAVAEHLGGTEPEFAKQMTIRAQEIGMTKTNFTNASGLPSKSQVTTAEDLAKLAIAIRRDYPRYYHWFARTHFTYNGRTMYNHNHLVGAVNGVDGLKTGYIASSGFNLAATANRNGQRIVTVVMGGTTWRERDAKVETLIEQAYNSLGINNYNASTPETYNYSLNEDDNVDIRALSMNKSIIPTESYSNTNFKREANGFTWRIPENLVLVSNKPIKRDINDDEGIVSANNSPNLNASANLTSNFASINTPQIQKTFEAAPVDNAPIISVQAETQTETISVSQNQISASEVKPIQTINEPQVIEANNNSPLPVFQLVSNFNQSQDSNNIQQNNDEIEKLRFEAKLREEARLQEIIEQEQAANKKQKDDLKRAIAIRKEQEQILVAKQAKLAEEKAKSERAIAAKKENERQMAQKNERGDTIVQVGAFRSKSDAQSALTNLARYFPSFGEKHVTTYKSSGSTWFRARIGGLGADAAKAACKSVTRSGGVCSIVSQ